MGESDRIAPGQLAQQIGTNGRVVRLVRVVEPCGAGLWRVEAQGSGSLRRLRYAVRASSLRPVAADA